MQFIRQNLFLVIVGGVLLIGGGVLLALIYQGSDATDQAMQPRRTLAGLISTIPQAKYVTPQQIKELEGRKEELQKIQESVENECRVWNSRQYPVLKLSYREAGKDIEIDAFPDSGRWRGDLYLQFKDKYRAQLSQLRNSLNQVKLIPPDEVDSDIKLKILKAEEKQHQEDLIRQKSLENARPEDAPATPDRQPVRTGPDVGLPPGITPRGGTVPTPTPGAAKDVSTLAREQAIDSLRLRQGERGRIYVADDALHNFWGNDVENSASQNDLWKSQLNLWVQGDIVRAINETNDYAINLAADKKNSVFNAAVKKLVKINVNKDYTMEQGASGTPTQSGGGAYGGSLTPDGRSGGFQARPDYKPPGVGPGGSGLTAGGAFLTQHYSCVDFDVLHYKFTVIIPARYIPVLETSLMRQNFHTVLQVEATPIGGKTASVAPVPGGDSGTVTTVPEYYGPDALLEVTFQCELLLLTSWERGEPDPTDAKKWKLPPLMPKEVLAGELSKILRTADAERIKDIATPKGTP